jgi:dienelactone hydrolase
MLRAAALATVALLAWIAAGLASADRATAPHPRAIGPLPSFDAGVDVTDAVTVTPDGVQVRGWLATAANGRDRCVVLVPGIRGNRLGMLDRARWYLAHGWSALLVDLRGTGASERTRISFGWHEANDLAAWHAWLRAHGFTRVAAHGQSLGAAAVVYTTRVAPPPPWEFAVLEACYGDVDGALANRLPWVPLPRVTLWPLRAFAEWLAAVDADDLRPRTAIAALRAPTLLACGDRDDKVGAGVSDALLAASGAADKRLVLVPGTGHHDLWSAGPTLRDALAPFLLTR